MANFTLADVTVSLHHSRKLLAINGFVSRNGYQVKISCP